MAKAYSNQSGNSPTAQDLGEAVEVHSCPTIGPRRLDRRHNPSDWVTTNRLQESQAKKARASKRDENWKNLMKSINNNITIKKKKLEVELGLVSFDTGDNPVDSRCCDMPGYDPRDAAAAGLFDEKYTKPQSYAHS